jgi:hypothetical protein
MRKLIAEKRRSDEHARGTTTDPASEDGEGVKAVANVFGIDEKDLRHRHGGAPRMLAA